MLTKTYKYKIYHSKRNKYLNEQTKICGNIYNHCISLHKRYYRMYGIHLNKYILQKHITKLKKLDKYLFWNKVGSQAIQDITDRIERGYTNFFRNCKKEKKTRIVSPPSFKRVNNYSSFTLKQAGYKILNGNRLKIGNKIYKYHKSRDIEGEVKCVTIKKDRLGDWYIYFICNSESFFKLIPMTGKTAGFDFGCITFLTKNNGSKIQSPLFFKQSQKDIVKANRNLSRKIKGSNNRKKAKSHLNRVHRKISNRRMDFHSKLAKTLCETYDTMFFETLNIESMKKKHGKKINDLGFSDFVGVLAYKSLEYGKTVHLIDKWFASTKICNVCGFINNELTERDRTWDCPNCKSNLDRDINAAINIMNQGLKELSVGISTDRLEEVRLDENQAIFV